MPKLRWVAAVALSLLARAAWSVPLELSLTVHGGSAQGIERVTIELQSRGSRLEPRREVLRAPSRRVLDLPPETRWIVEAKAPGFWAPVQTIAIGRDAARELAIELRPAGRIAGRIEVGKGEIAPGEIGLRVTASPGAAGRGAPPAFEIRCPVAKGAFGCVVPAGTWDLRARAREHVSHFIWSLAVPRDGTAALGTLKMRRGASVVGWVRAAGGAVDTARVELAPLQSGPSRFAEGTSRALSLATRANSRGFFQLAGVTPGTYVLTASSPGFAPTRFFPLTVLPDSESQMRDALVLEPPLALEVRIEPATDPAAHPWQVEIVRRGEAPGVVEPVTEPKLDDGGSFRVTGLSSGRYAIAVSDGNGSRWSWREVDLAGADEQVELEIPVIPMRGQLELGGQPLVGTLWFGGKSGAPSVRFGSNRKGSFSGFLPREGHWTVEVEATTPRVSRRMRGVEVRRLKGRSEAVVSIDLPAGRLAGSVVDESDRPAPGALVSLSFPGLGERLQQLRADEGGEFELHGLATGEAFVSAEAKGLSSAELGFSVGEGRTTSPIRLVLRERRRISGSVVGAYGGVPGATLLTTVPGQATLDYARTDAAGAFSLSISPSPPHLDVVLLPPGYALRAVRVPAQSEALRLPVEQDGGTLVLEGALSNDPDAPAGSLALVVHNGVVLYPHVLADWARLNGQAPPGANRLVVPQVELGDYALCRVAVSMLPEIARGARPTRGCTGGYLAPGGELTLRLRDEPGAAGH